MAQTALITGASGGIGRALAIEFARHGYDLVLVARNRGALADVARTVSALRQGAGQPRAADARIIAADLSHPGSAHALVEQLHAAGIQVDVLVNNAGFAMHGAFAALPPDQQRDMVHLNVMTLTELSRLLLPAMLSRRTGGMLNVASTAAFQPGPLMSVYYATKAYVLSFTEGIAEEVTGSGLKVSCLCPGPTETGFAVRASVTETNLFKRPPMDADQVAREGFAGWHSGRVVVIPGASNRLGTFLVRILPRGFVRRAVKGLNSPAG